MTVKTQPYARAIHFPDLIPGERPPKIRKASPTLPVRARLRRKVVDTLSDQQPGTNEKIQRNAEVLCYRPGPPMNISQAVVERYQDRSRGQVTFRGSCVANIVE